MNYTKAEFEIIAASKYLLVVKEIAKILPKALDSGNYERGILTAIVYICDAQKCEITDCFSFISSNSDEVEFTYYQGADVQSELQERIEGNFQGQIYDVIMDSLKSNGKIMNHSN